MKLAEKGRFAPPPALPTHAQAVADGVATMADVHARTHWLLGDETEIDGADYYLGETELGHIHLDGEAHIAVSPKMREALLAAGLATRFRWSDSFVVFRITRASDVQPALRLFELSYARRSGASARDLADRIAALASRAA